MMRQELGDVLRSNMGLWRLWVNDNPLCVIPKYREEVTSLCVMRHTP